MSTSQALQLANRDCDSISINRTALIQIQSEECGSSPVAPADGRLVFSVWSHICWDERRWWWWRWWANPARLSSPSVSSPDSQWPVWRTSRSRRPACDTSDCAQCSDRRRYWWACLWWTSSLVISLREAPVCRFKLVSAKHWRQWKVHPNGPCGRIEIDNVNERLKGFPKSYCMLL